MGALGKFNVGIVGACGRGKSFKTACDALEQVRILAVCDVNAAELPAARERLGATEAWTDYAEMLEKSDLDAVILGTPMHLHVPQALAALARGRHVLSEVPAGVSVAECRELVAAAKRSRGVYMMAENYTYARHCVTVREMVRRGEFGTPYYAEGEYLHELKGLNEITRWRRKWQTGINGITYGTHSLGPILQWMPGERVVSVCCAGSGHHWRDPRGAEYENEDSCVMLCRMAGGALVKVRVDMLSDRPHAMTNYQLQGTDGGYESARSRDERGKVWLRALGKPADQWTDLAELEAEFLPPMWREASAAARGAGHGGGDYFEVLDFVEAALGRRPPPVGIDEAMDMTLPGLLSQQSILEGGRWVEVPDSRKWRDQSAIPRAQLQMVWPQSRLGSPPAVTVPAGYRLRTFQPGDAAAHAALMVKAGFADWTPEKLAPWLKRVLPDGFFVIEHVATGALAATAMATHNPTELHPSGGELGWVAGDPAHKGSGLGLAVSAAAVARFLGAGYRRVYLQTDDWRLAAVKVYLRLGLVPLLHAPDMAGRWRALCEKLGWPFAPENWS